MKRLARSFLKISFPPKCIFCGKLVDNAMLEICPDCLETLPRKSGNLCPKCSVPVPYIYGSMFCKQCRSRVKWFDRAVSPLVYRDDVRHALTNYKFHARKYYAKTFAYLTAEEIRKSVDSDSIDYISFVPLHIKRRITRGYDQSKIIAQYIAEFLNIPLLGTLKKVKNTPMLSRQKNVNRYALVKGIYALKPSASDKIYRKNILLVDDIITTGATLSECSHVLKSGGAKSVIAATTAQTVSE